MKDSYEYYERIREEFGEKDTGIIETSGYVLSNISEEEVKVSKYFIGRNKKIFEFSSKFNLTLIPKFQNPLIENVVPDYHILSPEELKNCPGEWKYGSYFKSFIIQGRIFLPWALNM